MGGWGAILHPTATIQSLVCYAQHHIKLNLTVSFTLFQKFQSKDVPLAIAPPLPIKHRAPAQHLSALEPEGVTWVPHPCGICLDK